VKDQITGTDDGVASDVQRMQELLSITHRWGGSAPQSRLRRYAAVVYFVGKSASQYKKGRHLASQFMPFADRTVATSLKNLHKVLDKTKFHSLVRKQRVVDSAIEGSPDPELVGTQDEELVSGLERFTYCVCVVIWDSSQ
jgi:hypothetical protein